MTTSSTFRTRDALILGLLALLWGNSFLLIKTAVRVVPPLWVVTIRMAIGGTLLLLVIAALRARMPRDARMVATLVGIGVLGGAMPWAGQAWAQQYLDSGLVAVLNSCTPVATLIIAVLVGQEALYRNRVVGLGLSVCGTLVVIGGEVGSGRSIWALLMAVVATTGYAFAGVATRARVSGRVDVIPAAALQLCGGAVALAPVAWGVSGPISIPDDPIVIGALLALGLFGTGVGFILFFTLLQNVGATNASMVTYLVPVVGLVSGALVRGERFGANVFVGAAALIAGVWLAQRKPVTTLTAPARLDRG